ncbi:HAD family hydrolase [Actinomycetes bacterium KLBMP 9797]
MERIEPRALLMDFGGVLADAPRESLAPPALVSRLRALAGGALTDDAIARALVEGAAAYARWRDEVGALDEPAELTHAEAWDFVTRAWPAAAREAVRREATPLAYAWAWRPSWAVRPGIPEVLAAAAAAGIPVAVVSNTLCGAAHRDFLDQVGLGDRFAVQIYSDEAGVRKPNPRMAWLAAEAVGVPVGECWFVGDSYARDVACARRAGVGYAVLMRSPRTARETPTPDLLPDASVDDGHTLAPMIRASLT